MHIKATLREAFKYELGGVPLFPFGMMAAISLAILASGNLVETGLPGAFAVMWSFGFVFFAIGEKLPIWREYVGGGLIMAFLASAALAHFGWVSQVDAAFMMESVIGNRFLYFLLVLLVASSLLAVDRATLIRSVAGYVPIILCGVAGAAAVGVTVGMLLGVAPERIITHYVLPVMGGGNAAGAIPMSEVYADATGKESGDYYGFAISVLTIANLIAILAASALNKLGQVFPAISGNGKLMRFQNEADAAQEDSGGEELQQKPGNGSQGAIFFGLALLLLSMALYTLFPIIHVFAWAVLLILLLNVLDILPRELVVSLQTVSAWGMRLFIVLVLVAVGLMTDLNELANALSLTNVVIAGAIVLGAILGTGVSGWFLGFYPIEAALTAGLCMANRGGSGDLEVLGAARRLELYPYAQVSSRIGGGMVLFIAGYLFSILL